MYREMIDMLTDEYREIIFGDNERSKLDRILEKQNAERERAAKILHAESIDPSSPFFTWGNRHRQILEALKTNDLETRKEYISGLIECYEKTIELLEET